MLYLIWHSKVIFQQSQHSHHLALFNCVGIKKNIQIFEFQIYMMNQTFRLKKLIFERKFG